MSVYLGNAGSIEIRRKSLEDGKESVINPSDINALRDRFSFDFDEGFLISGDLVQFRSLDGTTLDFVDPSGWVVNQAQSNGNWYVHVDELGGVRLYDNFDDSLEGGSSGLVPLLAINRDIPVNVKVRDRDIRLLACITDYELNTNRETVDITALSDEHRQQYSSLITGSGTITAQWDYFKEDGTEPVHYLMQLVLRTEIGSEFGAKLYIKSPGAQPANSALPLSQIDDALWWEFDALVTNSATSFAPGDIVVSRVDFVTTGPIRLRAATRPNRFLLQESGDKIRLEQNPNAALLLEETD
jgi:hypothetical protein